MNSIIIKQAPYHGQDSKTFRAYTPATREKDEPLGISASTTGNQIFGVMRCAAKAFIKFTEPKADPCEIETRIKLTQIGSANIWTAELQPK